jgi:hypothetical protein
MEKPPSHPWAEIPSQPSSLPRPSPIFRPKAGPIAQPGYARPALCLAPSCVEGPSRGRTYARTLEPVHAHHLSLVPWPAGCTGVHASMSRYQVT